MNQFTLFLLIHTFLGVAGDPQITHDLSTPSSSKTITDRFDPTLLPNEPLIHPTVNERQLTEGRQLGGTQFIHARTTGKCEKMAITAVGGKWIFYIIFIFPPPRNISNLFIFFFYFGSNKQQTINIWTFIQLLAFSKVSIPTNFTLQPPLPRVPNYIPLLEVLLEHLNWHTEVCHQRKNGKPMVPIIIVMIQGIMALVLRLVIETEVFVSLKETTDGCNWI